MDMEAMYALMQVINPPPKRELRCGRTAWDVLRINGDTSARRSHLDAFMGIPVHIDPEMADGAWKIIEDGEVLTEGDMTPGFRRSYWIAGVGLVGASEEAAAMIDANIEQSRRGGQ